MKHISAEDYREFERRFPDAAIFLIYISLKGELQNLRYTTMHFCPTEWERNRLLELESWERSTKNIAEE